MSSKKTINDYKRELKLAKESADRNQKWGEKWCDYAYDISSKLDVALERLQTIAENRYYTSENTTKNDQVTAAIGLRKIARMRERKQ